MPHEMMIFVAGTLFLIYGIRFAWRWGVDDAPESSREITFADIFGAITFPIMSIMMFIIFAFMVSK